VTPAASSSTTPDRCLQLAPRCVRSRTSARAHLLADRAEIAGRADTIELVHKLATIFYQLGKAYVLAGTDPDYLRTRVFEAAVDVEPTQTSGRGFVDGVVLSGKGEQAGGVDWQQARSMLNGRLKEITSPVEKGRRLLEEAVAADPGTKRRASTSPICTRRKARSWSPP
jgi:hypothetical protein